MNDETTLPKEKITPISAENANLPGISGIKYVEILVFSIILGTLAFVAKEVVTISGKLGGVDAMLKATTDRIDRIANVLPDVGVRIAQEEITRPIRTAVITSNPKKEPSGEWVSIVHVIDTISEAGFRFRIPLSSKDDRIIQGALAWTGAKTDERFLSVSRLQEYSRISNIRTQLPVELDPHTSFMLCSEDADKYMHQIAWLDFEPEESPIHLEYSGWIDLAKKLKELEGQIIEEKK